MQAIIITMVKNSSSTYLSPMCNSVPSSSWGLFWSAAFGTSVVSDSEAGERLTPGRQDLKAPKLSWWLHFCNSAGGGVCISNSCNRKTNP